MTIAAQTNPFVICKANLLQEKKINKLFIGLSRSVWEKTVPLVFGAALGLRPRAVLKTSGTVFFPYGPPAR